MYIVKSKYVYNLNVYSSLILIEEKFRFILVGEATYIPSHKDTMDNIIYTHRFVLNESAQREAHVKIMVINGSNIEYMNRRKDKYRTIIPNT